MINRAGQVWKFLVASDSYDPDDTWLFVESHDDPAGTLHRVVNLRSGESGDLAEHASEGPLEWRDFAKRIT